MKLKPHHLIFAWTVFVIVLLTGCEPSRERECSYAKKDIDRYQPCVEMYNCKMKVLEAKYYKQAKDVWKELRCED